uniref:sigma-54-dependent transcriptional regulator n=1 Tax=Alistipes sp. TaxID=1872444 RepID=UPI0040576616
MRNTLCERLSYEGIETQGVESLGEAKRCSTTTSFDLLLAEETEELPSLGLPYIVVAAEASIDAAVRALRQGAEDYLTRPVDMNRLLGSVRRALSEDEPRLRTQATSRARRPRRQTVEPIIGTSQGILRVKELIQKVAPSQARVLITGENGTGKELVARWLHEQSARAEAPFVEVNCAAIPSELIESELFGHERGAFTSAVKQRKGKFEQADGGTLFMDEIGDMSLSAQAKVLRALQERKISRVGSDKDVEVDVRVIAATNKNLTEEIQRGNFREDLYHRLSVIRIEVPALRNRSEDIPLLVSYFMQKIAREEQCTPKRITDEALGILSSLKWSGNIRELHNVVERLVILSGEEISAEEVRQWVV